MANANSHSSSSWAQLDTAPDCEPAGARLCAEHQPQQLKNPEAAGEFQPSALRSRCGWSATQPRSGGSVKMRPFGRQPKAALEQWNVLSYYEFSLMSIEAPAKLTHNEEIKEAIPTLAGTIASTLANAGADSFSADDNQFLKFHGCYQQDDRDQRSG